MLTIAIWHILENGYRNQAHEKNNKFQVTKVFFCIQVKLLNISFERFPSTRSHLGYLMHSLSSMELMKLQWEHLCVHCQESWNRYKTHFEHVAGLPGPCVLVYRPQKPTLYDQHSYLTVQNCSSCIIFQIRISNSPLQIFSFNQSNSGLPVDTSLISTNRCSFYVLVTFWVLWRTEKVF